MMSYISYPYIHPQAGWALTFFQQQKKVSKTRPYRTVRSGGNAAAADKIAKNHGIPLKENNSLASDEIEQIFFLNVTYRDFLNAFYQRRRTLLHIPSCLKHEISTNSKRNSQNSFWTLLYEKHNKKKGLTINVRPSCNPVSGIRIFTDLYFWLYCRYILFTGKYNRECSIHPQKD